MPLTLLEAHIRYREFLHSLPHCRVKGCRSRITWGMRYGKMWRSKYCAKHAHNKKRQARIAAALGVN